jgi:Tol biopolymer transport system component
VVRGVELQSSNVQAARPIGTPPISTAKTNATVATLGILETSFTETPDLITSTKSPGATATQSPVLVPTNTPVPTNSPAPTITTVPTNSPVPTPTSSISPPTSPLDKLMARSGTFFFTSFRNNTNEIYQTVLKRNFSTPVKVVPLNGQKAINTGDPNISPDGRFVAYYTNAYAPPDAQGNPISTEVYISPINDSSQRVKIGDGVNPSWSPDGFSLIWVSGELGCGGDDLIKMRLSIIGSSVSSSGAPSRMTCDGLRKRNPRWSPQGVVVFTLSSAKNDNTNLRLVKVASTAHDTTTYDQLTTFGLYPNLSPDGSQVVFSSGDAQGRNAQIFVVSLDGGNPRQLTTDGWNYRPVWLPNNLILFSSNRERPGQTSSSIWAMEFAGTNQQRVPIPGDEDNYSIQGFLNP